MKKFTYLFLLYLFFVSNSSALFSQTNYNVLSKSSKLKADSILTLGKKKQDQGDYITSIELFQKSLDIYNKGRDFKMIGDCNSFIAISYYYQGDYDKALTFFEISKKNYQKINYKSGVSSINNNIGGIQYFLGKYIDALESYQSVLELQKELNDKDIIASTTQNIGLIYSKIGDFSKAKKYYNDANKIFLEIEDKKALAKNFISIAYVFIQEKNYKMAENFLNKAYSNIEKKEDVQVEIEILQNFGELNFRQSKLSESFDNYIKCLALSKKINNKQYLCDSKIAIGKIYNEYGKNKLAINFCDSGLKIANEIGSLSLKKEACDCLYQANKTLGNTKSALSYFEKSEKYKDSLNMNETSNKMMSMEFQNKQLLDSLAFVNKQHAVQLKHKEELHQKEKQRNYILGTLGFIVLLAGGLYNRLNFVRKSKKALQFEKDRSEKLLLNILPEEIAQELKEKGSVNARDFNLVAVLFTDFKSFTETSEKMTPQELVEEINVCFKAFDLISEKYNVEKIKTIGDAYMAAGGIPIPDENFLANIVLAGLEMQEFMINRKHQNDLLNKPAFEMRLGIHAGPIVAGIVGIRKFQYDVWGDTVNTASRIESNGTVGKVNISESLYQLLKNSNEFVFEYRGNIHAKGKGHINMYYVEKIHKTINVSTEKKSLKIEENF